MDSPRLLEIRRKKQELLSKLQKINENIQKKDNVIGRLNLIPYEEAKSTFYAFRIF